METVSLHFPCSLVWKRLKLCDFNYTMALTAFFSSIACVPGVCLPSFCFILCSPLCSYLFIFSIADNLSFSPPPRTQLKSYWLVFTLRCDTDVTLPSQLEEQDVCICRCVFFVYVWEIFLSKSSVGFWEKFNNKVTLPQSLRNARASIAIVLTCFRLYWVTLLMDHVKITKILIIKTYKKQSTPFNHMHFPQFTQDIQKIHSFSLVRPPG